MSDDEEDSDCAGLAALESLVTFMGVSACALSCAGTMRMRENWFCAIYWSLVWDILLFVCLIVKIIKNALNFLL